MMTVDSRTGESNPTYLYKLCSVLPPIMPMPIMPNPGVAVGPAPPAAAHTHSDNICQGQSIEHQQTRGAVGCAESTCREGPWKHT
jgi:hypothetical protein